MYLSKLEILGFKSFAQKVTLAFDAGISAIVGPNGCGKTNIVDAIRWVLGEQRYSALRSERMEDVIFSGTKGRKPLARDERPRPAKHIATAAAHGLGVADLSKIERIEV